jgi:hypothetical protein
MDGWSPDPKVAIGYGVHLRTMARWDKQPELKFPKPRYVNGRKYRNIEELRQWDLWRAAGGGGKATRKPAPPPRVAAANSKPPVPGRGLNPERT